MKKAVKIVLIVIAALLAAALIGVWALFGGKLRAARSVEKLDERLYAMEYTGDYGFDAFLADGGASSADEMASYIISFLSHGFYKMDSEEVAKSFGCSTVTAVTPEGHAVCGRNYDWTQCTAMLVHTKPTGGYESVSTACLDFLGFGEGWVPEGLANRLMALAAIYVPMDGMNETGLVVADLMAGDDVETHQDTEKPDLTTTSALRLLLDHAATVDEAVALLEQYDMNSDIGAAHHYYISDAAGAAVVVEYIDGRMVVTDTPVVTNFYLSDCEKQGVGSRQSHDRYDRLIQTLADCGGVMSMADVRDALQSVSQGSYHDEYEITAWSLVYDQTSLTADFYQEEDYTRAYTLALKTGGAWRQSPAS